MQRTPTVVAAALVVAVSALSAVSGCSADPPRRPGPQGAPAAPTPRSSSAAPDADSAPRMVRTPAQQALQHMGAGDSPTGRPPAPGPSFSSPARPPARDKARPSRPAPPAAPSAESPSGPDLCALARQYGDWKDDSEESRICDSAYGRGGH